MSDKNRVLLQIGVLGRISKHSTDMIVNLETVDYLRIDLVLIVCIGIHYSKMLYELLFVVDMLHYSSQVI